jgi:hypothetical protein
LETKGIIIVGKLRVEKMRLWQQHFTVELRSYGLFRLRLREAVSNCRVNTPRANQSLLFQGITISVQGIWIYLFIFCCKSTKYFFN